MRTARQPAPAAARPPATWQHDVPLRARAASAPDGPSAGLQRLQRALGNQAMLRLLQARAIQPKLTVGPANDAYEREADRMADAVMRMPGRASPPIQRACSECEKEEPVVQGRRTSGEAFESSSALTSYVTSSRGGGQPLPAPVRARFESRFGHDFGAVRVHAGARSHAAASEIHALAFTSGSDIHFGAGQFRPGTYEGDHLLAHELTHVIQQGAAPAVEHRWNHGNDGAAAPRGRMDLALARHIVQRWPGDGMTPPGDCDWSTYLALRAAVETAKAIVSSLGACAPGDSCTFLALKISAIAAEIAARVALDTVCFRGGDTGHRQQVMDKVNMLNRCYRFFTQADCPQQLLEAMRRVIERAAEVIAAAVLAVVAVALVIALIYAIIALLEILAAAGAAAAAAGAAAAVLLLILGLLPSEGAPAGEAPGPLTT